nr:CopD family protein [Anaeromyxobacter sp. SG63]
MILLAGFLDVIFDAVTLAGLAGAAGGIAFAFAVLLPLRGPLPSSALRDAAAGVALGAATVAGFQGARLLLAPWSLADEQGAWPLGPFLETGFAHAGLLHAGLAVAVAGAALRLRRRPGSRRGWTALALVAAALVASRAWLVHAVSRPDDRALLMTITDLHQLAAAVWVGGLAHLLALRLRGRRDPARASAWPAVLARFSRLAFAAVALVVATGLALAWRYVGGVAALVGTAYGAMVLTKVALLGMALVLAAQNRRAVQRWRRAGDRAAADLRIPFLVEAEAGAAIALLLAAAALTAQPPAVDVTDQRATLAEVAGVLAPKVPRLVPPPHGPMVAASPSSVDPYAQPGPLDRWQSDFNHNVAGIVVLLAAVAAFADRWSRLRVARHWPLLFLLLAAFLLLLAEPNGWPFGPEGFFEVLTSPSVLQHRAATLLVVALAVLEWRVRAGRLAGTRWRFAFPVLCGVGGALLLTHSHSVLASRWAYLVEVSHNAIGVLAVAAALGAWLELRLPPREGRIPAAVWTASMGLVGLVLLFYRE